MLIAILNFVAFPSQTEAAKRVALVIGNAAYTNAPQLPNPVSDASDMAQRLKGLGFEVIAGLDLDKFHMDQTIREFVDRLAGAEVGLFFYAGHGFQLGGDNYLVPIDAKLATPPALDFETVRLDLIQRTMERQTRTNIIILDACRDNPLARNLQRVLGSRSAAVQQGLARMESGEGTLISFSTQPGNVALDGAGRNSPFAEALLNQLSNPQDDLSSLFIKVRRDVMAATDKRQVPWENSALTEKFFFVPPKPLGPTVDQQLEMQFWSSVKDSTNPDVLRTYLLKYPDGVFSALARALIDQFEQQRRAERAAREEEMRHAEEGRKAAELHRLEEERKAREAALAEEKRKVEEARAAADLRKSDEQRRLDASRQAAELARALEEVKTARDAVQQAEAQRKAALQAVEDAQRAAKEASLAAKQLKDKNATADAETAFWTSVKDSTNPDVIKSYLEKYPAGTFATLARALMEQHQRQRDAQKAAREEDHKKAEEAAKSATVEELEKKRQDEALRLSTAAAREEAERNSEAIRRLEERQKAEELQHLQELKKVQDEMLKAREAAAAAEKERIAALEAAKEAKAKAEGEQAETEVRKREGRSPRDDRSPAAKSNRERPRVRFGSRMPSPEEKSHSGRPDPLSASKSIWAPYSLRRREHVTANTKYGKLVCIGGSGGGGAFRGGSRPNFGGNKRECHWQ